MPSRNKKQEIVISGFDYTGVMVKPWADAGYLCYCIDIQHPAGENRVGNIVYVGADIRTWKIPENSKVVFSAFFPPCTDLAVSGARWFKGKGLRKLAEAIELFAVAAELAEESGAPYIIENPVSTISSYWRKPDHTFHPFEYGGYSSENDAYTKKTCLWVGGGFVMPSKSPIDPVLGSKMHLLPPSDERANLRSATPEGFSKAVFAANKP